MKERAASTNPPVISERCIHWYPFPSRSAWCQRRPGFDLVLPGLEGEGKELWSHALEVGQGLIKPIFGNCWSIAYIALPTHVPFAKMSSGIARVLQKPRKHGCLGVEPLGHPPLCILGTVTQVGTDLPALGILAGGNGHTGG